MKDLLEITIIQPLLFGIIVLITGLIMYGYPPKKIKSFFGYCTTASIQSQERWDFSQKHSARQMQFSGVFMIIMSFAAKINPEPRNYEAKMGFAIIMLALLFIKLSTESAIKKQFKTQL